MSARVATAEDAQLEGMIDRFSADVAKKAKAILKKVRRRVPGAVELVYDNYNALAIAFGSSEKRKDIVFSIALYPRWVSMFFMDGPELDDPEGLLKGEGTVVRHVVLDPPEVFDQPGVQALLTQALARASPAIDPKAKRRVIIKSISPNQRPRRPAAKKKR